MAVSFCSSTQFSGTKISFTGDGFNKCSPDSIKFKSNRISAAAAATSTERPTSSSSYLSFNISSSSSKSSLYQVLGISMNATYQEIKSAYRKLARVFHPDVIDDMNSKHTSSADHFMEIHDAYSTLSDPSRRADYDRDLLFTTRRRTPLCYTTSSSSRPSSNWETDQCW
ncbi:Chaperone protein dnaj [Thalictrum thalictroides]|uniref:Chaperone protein dnaj n=1 Tax=Thalictrum thalictroides TaxID=46969 RepID=A0A7J6V2C5_THATH|nr:Chaperone protein dnaj [Thalictrum thalictroides]